MTTEKQIYEQIQKEKDLKTIAEHTQIISHYHNTGYLDRDDALRKYKKFNDDHPDYYAGMTLGAKISGTAVQIDDVDDNNIIVGNMKKQVEYLLAKKTFDKIQQKQRN